MESQERTDAGAAAAGSLTDQVKGLASEAREGTGRVARKAKQQVGDLAGRQKDEAAESLGSLAGALRDTADRLKGEDQALFGRYAGLVAEQAEELAGYVRRQDVGALVRDLETFARRHPDVFLGGAFLAGVMAARFLKSSAAASGASSTASAETGPLHGEASAGQAPYPAEHGTDPFRPAPAAAASPTPFTPGPGSRGLDPQGGY